VRGASRRTRRAGVFRHQRVQIDVPSDPPSSEDAEADDEEGVEKIEVHVHLHRGDDSSRRARRKRPLSRPHLTGVLFDWQGHYDQIFVKHLSQQNHKRGFRLTQCKSCGASAPAAAPRCPRCAAPLASRLLPRLFALVGLGTIAGVFALCWHVLGSSVPEHKAPAPLGQWTSDDYVIVEIPATPSPFANAAPGGSTPGAR
jgi:hypothetical protein